VSLFENESSLAWYLDECSESDLEAGIQSTTLDHIASDPVTTTAIRHSTAMSPTPLEGPTMRSAITAIPVYQVPLDWDLSLCLDPESESGLPVDTSPKSAVLEDCSVDAETTVFAPVPTCEEPSESHQGLPLLSLLLILTVPSPSESATISRIHRERPTEFRVMSTTLYDHASHSAPATMEDQRVFNLESAIPIRDLLKLVFKQSEGDVINPSVSPSICDAPNAFSKLLEARPSSRRPLEDLQAKSHIITTSDPLLMTSKDRALGDLIDSLEDLTGCPRLEEDEDPVNRMPVMSSMNFEDRASGSASTSDEDHSVSDVKSSVTTRDVLEAPSGQFEDFATLFEIIQDPEDEDITALKPKSFINVAGLSYCSNVASSVEPTTRAIHLSSPLIY